jgi:CubicO group peptidase (beta-lactamase class C family)
MSFKLILRLIFILSLCFITDIIAAQSRQQQKTDSVFVLVGKYLRIKDADSIYALAGDKFKQSLSPAMFKAVADQQLFPLGEVRQVAVVSFVNNKIATYKVQFNVLTMEVLMSLDEKDKLELFYFRPFKIEPIDKTVQVATTNPMKSAQDIKVDSAARNYIQKINTTGLSIAVIKNGNVSQYNYGEIAKGSSQLPTSQTLYEIGSITKTFTAAILASYVNDGKLKLTDPITQYLPDSVAGNPALKDIMLVNLINHTSGLPSLPDNLAAQMPYDKLNPYRNYNKQLLFAYLKTCTLNTKPGVHYAYSNLAVGLLGTILEKISGKTFEEMAQTIVCGPLDMKNTVQHIYPLLTTRFAPVYNDEGLQTQAWDFDALASCGSLRSTVDDLVLYTKANLNDNGPTPLAKALKLTHGITFSDDAKLGLAWHIIKVDGVSYYFHNGGTYGSSSFLAFNADKNLAVIVLSNASASTDAVGVNILKKLQ